MVSGEVNRVLTKSRRQLETDLSSVGLTNTQATQVAKIVEDYLSQVLPGAVQAIVIDIFSGFGQVVRG